MLKHKNQAGFTMIEVMIVLAIAAIVLVGVLVAAQAFQRAGRNHQRAADARFVLATVNEYQSQTGQTPTDIKPFIGKLEEGLSYYHPTPGAISPSEILENVHDSINFDLESTSYLIIRPNYGVPIYQGRIFEAKRDVVNSQLAIGPRGHNTRWSFGNNNHPNTSCSLPRTETIGWPDCLILRGPGVIGRHLYRDHPEATEFIGIIGKAECLNQNNITFGSNREQIAVMYKLEGADSAQCIDI